MRRWVPLVFTVLVAGCTVVNEAPATEPEPPGIFLTVEHASGPPLRVLLEVGDTTEEKDVLSEVRNVGPGVPARVAAPREPGHSYTVMITEAGSKDGVFHTFLAASCGGGSITWTLRVDDGHLTPGAPSCAQP